MIYAVASRISTTSIFSSAFYSECLFNGNKSPKIPQWTINEWWNSSKDSTDMETITITNDPSNHWLADWLTKRMKLCKQDNIWQMLKISSIKRCSYSNLPISHPRCNSSHPQDGLDNLISTRKCKFQTHNLSDCIISKSTQKYYITMSVPSIFFGKYTLHYFS